MNNSNSFICFTIAFIIMININIILLRISCMRLIIRKFDFAYMIY